MQRYKLVFFTPRTSTQTVLQHLFARFPDHVGRIGAYGDCAFVSPGTGDIHIPCQFLPLAGANPAIGAVGHSERVEEDRVEVLVLGASVSSARASGSDHVEGAAGADAGAGVEMSAVLRELKEVHPYEEVAYDVYRLEDF